jgi:hypothetical protein
VARQCIRLDSLTDDFLTELLDPSLGMLQSFQRPIGIEEEQRVDVFDITAYRPESERGRYQLVIPFSPENAELTGAQGARQNGIAKLLEVVRHNPTLSHALAEIPMLLMVLHEDFQQKARFRDTRHSFTSFPFPLCKSAYV